MAQEAIFFSLWSPSNWFNELVLFSLNKTATFSPCSLPRWDSFKSSAVGRRRYWLLKFLHTLLNALHNPKHRLHISQILSLLLSPWVTSFHIRFQRILSNHSGIPASDAVDQHAKEAALIVTSCSILVTQDLVPHLVSGSIFLSLVSSGTLFMVSTEAPPVVDFGLDVKFMRVLS